jgi:RNA polymerase sigma factor (sigma-70 family)
LDIYFKDLAKIKEGETDPLVKGNLKLVVYFVKKYRRNSGLSACDMADLIQAGNTGLVEAARTYRDSGNCFSTYAAYYIKSAIFREIDNFRLIRLPENKRRDIRKAAAAVLHLEQNGRKPGDAEISSFLDWDPQKLRKISLAAET